MEIGPNKSQNFVKKVLTEIGEGIGNLICLFFGIKVNTVSKFNPMILANSSTVSLSFSG